MSEVPIQCVSYDTTVTFNDNYLFLGSKPDNRPLFVARYKREHRVNPIFVNIMPKSTMNDSGITVEELRNS